MLPGEAVPGEHLSKQGGVSLDLLIDFVLAIATGMIHDNN